jgi:hypothetical protein
MYPATGHHAVPALERKVEWALFRVTQAQRDVGERQVPLAQQALGHVPAFFVQHHEIVD